MDDQMTDSGPIMADQTVPEKGTQAANGKQTAPHLSQVRGLSMEEAVARRNQSTGNDLNSRSTPSIGQVLRQHLFTIFNLDLIGLVSLQLFFGRMIDALISAAVMLFGIFIGVGQEVWAWSRLSQLAVTTQLKGTVIRDGRAQEINVGEIVTGDVLVAGPGDQILADGVIISQSTMGLDESALTGASQPILKGSGEDVFAGTVCLSGQAAYEAQHLAADSYSDRLAVQMTSEAKTLSPLQKLIDRILRLLLLIVIYFSTLLIVSFLSENLTPELHSSLAGMVFALAPSGLFLMILVSYALGSAYIANKGALIPDLMSIESLAQVTILCLTNTSILTGAQIRLEMIKWSDGKETNTSQRQRLAEAEVRHILGDYARTVSTSGFIMDIIADAFAGHGRRAAEEAPFLSINGWSGVTFNEPDLSGLFVLGDPEILQPHLAPDLSPDLENRSAQQRLIDPFLERYKSIFGPADSTPPEAKTLLERGILLFAFCPETVPLHDQTLQPLLPANLVPLCFLHFSQQVRQDAKNALRWLVDEGVELNVISSAPAEQVISFARESGLGDSDGLPPKSMAGSELANLSDVHLMQAVAETRVFGKLSGAQKAQIVHSLQDQGQHVAVVGDSIDDLEALQGANLSIAMRRGSQATQNMADIVLADDSLLTLKEVFREGLGTVNGLLDTFKLYLTRIVIFILILITLVSLNEGLPHTGRQATIIVVTTVFLPSIGLSLTAPHKVVAVDKLAARLAHVVLPAGLLTAAAGCTVFLLFLDLTENVSYAQLTLTYTLVVCGLLFIVFIRPPIKRGTEKVEFSGDWFPTVMAIVLGILFFYLTTTEIIRELFDLTVLQRLLDYVIIALVVFIWALLLQVTWHFFLFERYLHISRVG